MSGHAELSCVAGRLDQPGVAVVGFGHNPDFLEGRDRTLCMPQRPGMIRSLTTGDASLMSGPRVGRWPAPVPKLRQPAGIYPTPRPANRRPFSATRERDLVDRAVLAVTDVLCAFLAGDPPSAVRASACESYARPILRLEPSHVLIHRPPGLDVWIPARCRMTGKV